MNLHDFLDFAFDHLDLNTAELVASRNYKQALKNLDKRRKKDDATYTQIVRATIAYLLHDYDNSLSLLNDYVKNYKPSYGPDVCERLYINLYALKSVGKEVKDKQLEDVFVQSIAAERDRDEKANLARDWIFLAIGRGQWHFVVKASQQLATIRSADSAAVDKQWTLQICARYLQHMQLQRTSGAGSELDRRLALQTLQKAAKDAPRLPATSTSGGKCISSEHQLRLLVEIYRREGQEEQLLELLHDPRFTAIVEGNNEFAHIKADLYLRNPPDALGSAATWVTGLFQRAAGDGGQWLRDDWQTWRLLTAGIAQGSVDDRSTVFNASEKLRQSESDHGPPTPMDRAGSLARLDLISHQTRTSTNDTRLQEALKDHFVRHQDKDIVAMDLEPYIRSLSLSGRVAFATVLHEVLSSSGNEMRSADVGSKPTLAAPSESYAALDDHLVDTLLTFRQTNAREHLTWLRIATNAVTVDRLLMSQTLPTVIGDPSKHANVIQSLTSYATLAFDLYSRACRVNELSPERTPASGAAKSALGNLFWALTAIHGTTHDASISSLRSLCYLLPSRTQSTTEWRIQLISDLQRQGASSYAWSFYDDMDIRHITVDAAAPLMFCRVSMINLSGSNGFRPYIDIGKHLEPYRDALNRIPHHQDMALDRDHEAQCIGMHDLLNEMRDSPVRWMLGLERRRIARLQRLQFEEDDLKHAPEHLPRTLSSATRKPWAYATGLITSTYVYFLAHLDDLSRLATCEPAIEAGILEQVRARQAEYLHETSITDDLQREERAVLSSYKRLTLVFGGLLAGSPDLVLEALQQLVKKVDALRSLPPQKSTNSVPSYQYHLQCSLSLELIDILLRTCKKVSLRMKGGKVKASVSSVETISKKAAEAIRSQLRKRIGELNELSKKQDLAKELAAPASLQQLTDHVISTLGKDSSEAHLRETVVSCRLSLESLLNIKCG